MTGLEIAGGILLIIISVGMIALIVLQDGGKGGMEALGGSSETYLGRNGDRGRTATLARFTKILGIAFVVVALALNILAVLGK